MDVRKKNTGARKIPFLFLALLKSSTITCSWAHTYFFVVWQNSSFYSPKGCKSKLLQIGNFFLLNSTQALSQILSTWRESPHNGWMWGKIKSWDTSHPQFFSTCSPKGSAKDHEKTRMINSYMVLLIAKTLNWLFCLGMNPRKERSKIQLPVWMPVPELVVEKAAKGSLLELLCGPDPFCPSNFSKCDADWRSFGRSPVIHRHLGIWSI